MRKFEPEVPDLGIFLLEFEKTIVIFQISTLKYGYLQNFWRKRKCLKFEPKGPYLVMFDKSSSAAELFSSSGRLGPHGFVQISTLVSHHQLQNLLPRRTG